VVIEDNGQPLRWNGTVEPFRRRGLPVTAMLDDRTGQEMPMVGTKLDSAKIDHRAEHLCAGAYPGQSQ